MTVIRMQPKTGEVDDLEHYTRVELAACYRLVHHFGMDELIWNHISARIPGSEGHFLLNPLGLRYDEICASNLVKVDKDGNVLDGLETNLTGFVIHSAIHMNRPDIQCVLHTHSEGVRFVSVLENGFVPMTQDGFTFHNDVAYHEYEGLSDDIDERDRLAESLGEHFQLILRNHGAITLGRTIGEAFVRMYYFERVCKLQMYATSSKEKLSLPKEALIKKAYDQTHQSFAPGTHEWPSLMRLAEKLDPSYKD